MQMLPRHFRLSGSALCVAMTVILGGCASKNPLMEEPAPIASKAKPAVPAPQAEAAGNNAAEESKVAAPSVATEPAAAVEPVVTAPAASPANAAAPTAVASATPSAAPATTANASATPSGVQVQHKKRFLGIFSPYRPDIQQGNFVSQEMVAQLKVGMTPDQVIFLLGTPLLNDVFHGERWDYPFRMQKGNGEITTSSVTVYFENNRVSRIEGGDLPTEADYLARIANKAKQKK